MNSALSFYYGAGTQGPPSPPPFKPAPREYAGNMCGVRVPGLPSVPGGSADPSLVLSWFIDRYSLSSRQRIYPVWRGKGIKDVLTSWPDSQDFGYSPQQFLDTQRELISEGFYPGPMLSAKPTSSAMIRTVQQTIDNMMLVVPLLVGVVPRASIGWELNLWLAPVDLRLIINTIAPLLVAGKCRVYVHFSEGVSTWQLNGQTFADFWNLNVGKITGVWRQEILAQTPDERRYASGGITDVLTRFAGNFGVVRDSGFGHPFDDIELEVSASYQFDGSETEAQGDAQGTWAINTPAQAGPAGLVSVMGSGNGRV